MSDNTIPLSVVGNGSNHFFFAQIAIGGNILTQKPTGPGYWIVVIDRSTLTVVYNQMQTNPSAAPDLGSYNSTDYILIVATTGVGLNNQPQGDFFTFLDLNGAGRQLRHVDQIAAQFNCGTYGTFSYALVGVLGNQNVPGFEASQISTGGAGPFLTVQLLPVSVDGRTIYTPVQLSDA